MKSQSGEGFPSLWLSNPDLQSDFDFPNPKENDGFHKALGFHFTLLSGIGICPL